MSGPFLLATLIGLAQPVPSNPDDLQWDELEEPEPAPAEAAPTTETAPPPTEAPAPEAAPDGSEPPAPPPTEAQPSPAPVLDEPGPTPDEPVSETAVEFTPAQPQNEIAELQPPGADAAPRKKRPSMYGRLWAGPVLGFGSNLLALGVGATYFVVPHFGLGMDLVNVFRWGADNNFYEFQLTPQATFLMLPRLRASPYFWAGFGLDTFNQGLGTYGRWVSGGGVIMRLGRRAVLRLGVEFSGRVPESRWNQNFTCGPFRGNCTVGIAPVIGLSIPFG